MTELKTHAIEGSDVASVKSADGVAAFVAAEESHATDPISAGEKTAPVAAGEIEAANPRSFGRVAEFTAAGESGTDTPHVSADQAVRMVPATEFIGTGTGGDRDGSRPLATSGERVGGSSFGEVIIEAQGLELKTLLGCPYSGINLTVKRGQVFALRGRNGSGKTALLLTLGGRMLFTKGSLFVLGYKLPFKMRAVQKRVGMALFEGQNDLPETQLVRSSVAAEFELYGRKPTKEDVAAYLREWGLDEFAEEKISDLTERRLTQLGVALAWVGRPDIILVDDIESQMTKTQSMEIMKRLINLSRTKNVTILVGVLERDLAAMADGAIFLGEE